MIPVNASTSWGATIQVTNNVIDDIQSVITYDPTAPRQAHIAWVRELTDLDATSREIYYANSLNWSKHVRITVDDFEDYNPMIDMDANGIVHIVWVNRASSSEENIMYTNSSNFAIHVDISQKQVGINHWPTLRVELNTGVPHIAWAGDDPEPTEEIYYKKGLGGPIQQITNTPSDNSICPSIDLDEGNNWHIVWEEHVDNVDVRYINKTGFDSAGPATPTLNYLNVSDQGVDNQVNDLRPDISVDRKGQCHVTWYINPGLEIYYAVSPVSHQFFWNLGAVTEVVGASIENKNPSIKTSKNSNPVIIFERNAQDWDIYATDYNSSWAVSDISNNAWTDYLEMSSIGALDIDLADRLFATYYTDVTIVAPIGKEIFVVTGSVAGEGIPGFEPLYLLLAFIAMVIIVYLHQFKAKKLHII